MTVTWALKALGRPFVISEKKKARLSRQWVDNAYRIGGGLMRAAELSACGRHRAKIWTLTTSGIQHREAPSPAHVRERVL